MRSHPPTLLTLARRALLGPCGLDATSHVLCAVSGGPDSIALLHACCMLRDKGVIARVTAHGVDHGLRAEAKDELALGEALARAHDVPFVITRVSVPAGSNLQARARAARWEALDAARQRSSAHVIATGHHMDDRAETVLIRILRGAPLAALGVLPARDGDRIRPFIGASRADVRAHIQRHGLEFAQDPSNTAARFLRTRVREELLPLLTQLSPRIVEHLADLADAALASQRENPADGRSPDPRVESKRALSDLARLSTLARPDRPNARVSLKRGVVLSVDGAQALRSVPAAPLAHRRRKKIPLEP